MKESIVIKNFGPIKEVVIEDIKPMTVFIGESGSGKSTIMKTIAFFQWLYKKSCINSYLKYSGAIESIFGISVLKELARNGMLAYVQEHTHVVYQNGSYILEFKNTKLYGLENLVPKGELSLEKIAFISDKRNIIAEIDNTYRRSFYLDETYRDFYKASELIHELELDCLGVVFSSQKNGSFRKHYISSKNNADEHYTIAFRAASSGIQNVVPLEINIEYFTKHYDLIDSMNAAILNYLMDMDAVSTFRPVNNVGDIPNKRIRIFIEEPELSLYPDSQLSLMDYIVDRCFVHGPQTHAVNLMMATHSPYIVNYLNVLLKRKQESGKAYIDGKNLAVYCVHAGEMQNLIMRSETTGEVLVNTMDLSEAMQDISDEYKQLKKKRDAVDC